MAGSEAGHGDEEIKIATGRSLVLAAFEAQISPLD
jgi:hypothetical protein